MATTNKLTITIQTTESAQFLQDMLAHGPSSLPELLKSIAESLQHKASVEFQINSNSSLSKSKLKS